MELKTVGLTKQFGSKTAVNDLSIVLSNGVYGLLGANGCGEDYAYAAALQSSGTYVWEDTFER